MTLLSIAVGTTLIFMLVALMRWNHRREPVPHSQGDSGRRDSGSTYGYYADGGGSDIDCGAGSDGGGCDGGGGGGD